MLNYVLLERKLLFIIIKFKPYKILMAPLPHQVFYFKLFFSCYFSEPFGSSTLDKNQKECNSHQHWIFQSFELKQTSVDGNSHAAMLTR